MKTTSLTFFFLLLCNLTFGQETKLYDADFFPIEKKKKNKPVFFVEIDSLENSLNERFYTLEDSIFMKEIKTELNKDGEILSQTISKYLSDGKILQELIKDKNLGNFVFKNYNTEGQLFFISEYSLESKIKSKYFDKENKEILISSEKLPEPKDGVMGWQKYLSKNLIYPAQARNKRLEGEALISFTISEKGEIENIEILNPEEVHLSIVKEAYRIAKEYPNNWSPYILNDQARESVMVLPLRFRLGS